jgi:hypothetical protein
MSVLLLSAVLPGNRYNLDHGLLGRSHLFADPSFSEGESILQVILWKHLFIEILDLNKFFGHEFTRSL